MRTIIIVLLMVLVIGVCARARADSVYLGGWSQHLKSAHATNQTHEFLVFEHNNYMAGTFINSYNQRTEIVGYKYKLMDLSQYTELNFIPSLTYGYHSCYQEDDSRNIKLCVAAPLELQYTRYKIQPNLLIIPEAVVFGINRKF